MSTGGYWGDVGRGTPRARRREVIENEFIPYVKGVFQKESELQSAMLCLAQYWADEADDAVHATVVFSRRKTPIWPHRCTWDLPGEGEDESAGTTEEVADRLRDDTETCTSCDRGSVGWMPFDDNGEETIRAFASCCHEDGNQEENMAQSYLPYAVARRRPVVPSHDGDDDDDVLMNDGMIDVEIVGGPVRAWLDDESTMRRAHRSRSTEDDQTTTELFDLVYASRDEDSARQVLADHLMQKSDPLGEYIACSLELARRTAPGSPGSGRGKLQLRAAELEGRHGRSWLGPLVKISPAEHVVFDRGFVRALAVHIADDAIANEVIHAREWGTVQKLRFLPLSVQRLSKEMRSLRFVGPLNARGLEAFARAPLPIERVHVVLESNPMLESLASLESDHLRCLIVGTQAGGPGTEPPRRGRNPFTGEEITMSPNPRGRAELDPDILASLRRASWWKQLDEIVITSIAPSVVRAWTAAARAMPNSYPKWISFTGSTAFLGTGGFRVRVHIADGVATVDMPSVNGNASVIELALMLEALPSDIRIRIVPTRCFTPTKNEHEALSKVAARPIEIA